MFKKTNKNTRPSVKKDKVAFRVESSVKNRKQGNHFYRENNNSEKKSNKFFRTNNSKNASRPYINKESQQAKVISRSLTNKSENDFKAIHMKTPINSNFKKVILIIIIGLVVIAIGICAGIFAFMASTSAKMSISNEAKSVLAKPQDNQVYYTLFAADLDDNQDGIPDLLMLVRIDPTDKQFIVIQIPTETYVASQTGGGTTINNICQQKNDAQLINTISTFAEVGITHFVKINVEGLTKLINYLSGIEANLKEEIDNTSIKSRFIPAGKSILNGNDAITVLKEKHFAGGEKTITQNQLEIFSALTKNLLNNKNINLPWIIDQLAGKIQTDMSTSDFINCINSLSNITDDKILCTYVPGYKTIRENNLVYMIDATNWKYLKTQISYGMLPEEKAEKTIKDINPSSFTIFIRNGAGIDGAASTLSNQLKSLGYNVTDTDNASTNVYDETLIIYNDDKNKDNAEAVKNSILNGRLVNGNGLYELHSDIMIIIGDDYKI